MKRLPMTIGMLGAGLLIGVLSPAVAGATTDAGTAGANAASSSQQTPTDPEVQKKIDGAMQQIGQGAGCSDTGMCGGLIKVSDMFEMQKLTQHVSDLNAQQQAVIAAANPDTSPVQQMAKGAKS